ncbi:MAG: 2-phosphosulfolactate phosphatase [Bacteroidota bacterium]|nr:2-phosphosulfolactate phosphatase [Bacteroidota bacterium]MDP4232935.1 2-phosphosulfolactate phosphatase [Bacteroidota bacterium]MDP4241979.1 2-phosphosulfolactate phosphatase [Bacteroidota bacterium]MDP4286882.1 2-phosphosulfolactate phosphatase [Bacteroidota bacterium]
MQVTAYFSPNHLDELELRDKIVVVIDVLRASTTITYAMRAGAREIIPVASVEAAMKIVGNLHSTMMSDRPATILCGERGGKRIEGFKLGNSPLEYTEEAVRGKALILTTTNGAVALTKAKHARQCFVSSFVNMTASVDAIASIPGIEAEQLVILTSGREEEFSLEDATCAGMLITRLMTRLGSLQLSDSARAALSVYHQYGSDIYRTLLESDHGRTLSELGFEADILAASQIDSMPLVPVLEQNAIKKKLIFSESLRAELEGRGILSTDGKAARAVRVA